MTTKYHSLVTGSQNVWPKKVAITVSCLLSSATTASPYDFQASSTTIQEKSCWVIGEKSALLIHLIICQIFMED